MFYIITKLHHVCFNNFDMPFKTYFIRLHNLISINIFFTLKDWYPDNCPRGKLAPG